MGGGGGGGGWGCCVVDFDVGGFGGGAWGRGAWGVGISGCGGGSGGLLYCIVCCGDPGEAKRPAPCASQFGCWLLGFGI